MAVAAPTLTYAPRLRTSLERLRCAFLWMLVFMGAVVLVEPSPYEVMFLVTALLFAVTGLKINPLSLALLILTLLFNIGGAFALIPFLDQPLSVTFVVISFYLGFTAVFFASILTENTQVRLDIIRQAWIFGGLLASVCGIIGYLGIAGTADLFTRYGRAAGTFKDPNVFGPFVAVPAVLIIQGFMSGTLKRPILSLLTLLVLLGGVFFSFSRGAWGVVVVASIMTGALLFVTTPSPLTRARIIIITIVGAALLAVALATILSIDTVRETFEQRFALTQDYDTGAQGRFGKVGEAIALLLERPNGIGPLRFTEFFPEAPHNVYVNAFSAYGWLGGLSYLCLIAATLRIGWSTVWRRTPWQGVYIAFWSVTFCQILQGFQIDSDHWRHLWLLFGITWGLGAAAKSQASAPRRQVTPALAPAPWQGRRASASPSR